MISVNRARLLGTGGHYELEYAAQLAVQLPHSSAK